MPGPISVERPQDGVAVVKLDRPEALNALNAEILRGLHATLSELDAAGDVRCIVLTGIPKAFAAGADIAEMKDASAVDMYLSDHLAAIDGIGRLGVPVIAAVSGWCLGGGMELAMACDIVVAGEGARFGQPEIKIGVIPGAGGTQRLPRAVGKSLAMQLVLTGDPITSEEAQRHGLVSKVVADDAVLDEALAMAATIASRPPLAVRMGKDCVLRSYDVPVDAGLAYERQAFLVLFSSADKREGMAAFTEKREPTWEGR